MKREVFIGKRTAGRVVLLCLSVLADFAVGAETAAPPSVVTNQVVDLGTVLVEGNAVSKYRSEKVTTATFTDQSPESIPTVVDTLTEDYIREQNPTDLHDLLRYLPGIETGGKSLLIRQPGSFSIRGMGGTEPTLDGCTPLARGMGLFLDPFLLERVEVVKGPVGSTGGGMGAIQNSNGSGGSINLIMKGARLDKDEISLQENTSVGKETQRYRGMFDVNEIVVDEKLAMRVIGTADYYRPSYLSNGARWRESFALAPSFLWQVNDRVRIGLKTMFQYTDQPGYIGIPVWRGRPAAGWSWYDTSCRNGDRARYEGFLLQPYVDWDVSSRWQLRFGAGMTFSDYDFEMREPYYGTGSESVSFYQTGRWPGGQKYMTSDFSEGSSVGRTYNTYIRSINTNEFFGCLGNTFVLQPDYYYREGNNTFGTPVSRYGLLAQDTVTWGWFGLLGGVRYDFFRSEPFEENGRYQAHAVSPKGGLTIRPLDWLIFFGNISQTRTPTLGYMKDATHTLTAPWFATQYEGGLRVSPAEKLWLTLSTYRIEQENAPIQWNSGTPAYYVNEGRNTSRGVELSLTGDVTENMSVFAMYSYNYYTDRSVNPGEEGRDFERNPPHSVSLSTSYRLTQGCLEDIVLGAGYRFRDKRYATMRGVFVDKNLYFDPSHVFDVSASMPLSKFGGSEKWILTLAVRNLFDERYIESSRHFYECLPGEPRTFEIGLRATF